MPFNPDKPFKPVSPKGFDPSREFKEIKDEEPSVLSNARDFLDSLSENATDVLLGKGLIQKAATLVPTTVEYAYDRIADDGTPRSFGDTYEENLKEGLEYADKRRHASKTGAAIGTGLGLAAGMGMPGVGGSPLTRVLGNAAISAVDAGTRGEKLVDLDEAGKAGVATAGISTGLEAIPYVGKGIKAVSRLIPGVDDALPAVNKFVAKVGQFVPGTDINANELEDLLNNPAARRKARAMDGAALEEIGDSAAEVFKSLDDLTDSQMRAAYAKGELEFMKAVNANDVNNFNFENLNKIKGVVNERPELFGRANKVINQVDDILQRGGAKEIGTATQDMPLAMLKKKFGPEEAAKIQASRALDGRRYLDDVTKNVDYDKMLDLEKEMIVKYRQGINNQIEGLTGGKLLREVDAKYAKYAPAKKDAFFKLEVPLPSGGREITGDSALAFLKSDRAQSRFIEDKLNDLNRVVQEMNVAGASEVDRAIKTTVKHAKEGFETFRSLERLKRASGGPSSQAINGVVQVVSAKVSGGLSLIAMPITNPAGWMKMVDSADPLLRPIFTKITEASRKFLAENPQLATRIYLMANRPGEDKE